MRVLILTPWVPYPTTGACQQDRFEGMKLMKSMGWTIEVVSRYHDFQDRAAIECAFEREHIPLTLLPYDKRKVSLLLRRLPRIIRTPNLIDGAALESTHPSYEKVIAETVERFKPDVVWIEFTYHWPALRLIRRKYGIPVVMKSSLIEPLSCRAENGNSFTSLLKSIPKYPGETIAATESDFFLAITPDEEKWYRSRGGQHTGVLPLRGLHSCFMKRLHESKRVHDVVFLSSSYSMGHNRDALHFLLREVIPRVRKKAPGEFRFHLTGNKFPEEDRKFLAEDVRSTGFIDDLGGFLSTMDIAFSPWVSGYGMQQKVFEPFCRSLPLITHHTAGYPFIDKEDVLLGSTAEEFVEHFLTLRSADTRNAISTAAYQKAELLFGAPAIKRVMEMAVNQACKRI